MIINQSHKHTLISHVLYGVLNRDVILIIYDLLIRVLNRELEGYINTTVFHKASQEYRVIIFDTIVQGYATCFKCETTFNILTIKYRYILYDYPHTQPDNKIAIDQRDRCYRCRDCFNKIYFASY
jgi:hypothetical protein